MKEQLFSVLRAPHISEKSARLQENNQYVFEVAQSATKADVKAAVEGLFSVDVQAVNLVNAKGKVKRIYRWYATPWEILRQLPGLAGYLKPDLTVGDLEREARAKTDTAAAAAMQVAKLKLFASFRRRRSA